MADAFLPSSIAPTVTPSYSNTNPVIYHLNMVITMSKDSVTMILDGQFLMVPSWLWIAVTLSKQNFENIYISQMFNINSWCQHAVI